MCDVPVPLPPTSNVGNPFDLLELLILRALGNFWYPVSEGIGSCDALRHTADYEEQSQGFALASPGQHPRADAAAA